MQWITDNPDTIFSCHQDGKFFLAIHPKYGVVFSDGDEEEFEAKRNDLRPSVLRELYFTCTNLWVPPTRGSEALA